jgi:hypothetical protein
VGRQGLTRVVEDEIGALRRGSGRESKVQSTASDSHTADWRDSQNAPGGHGERSTEDLVATMSLWVVQRTCLMSVQRNFTTVVAEVSLRKFKRVMLLRLFGWGRMVVAMGGI